MRKNKITLEWHSILKDVLTNIWVVILSALIGLMGIFIVSNKVYSPEYTSGATLVVNSRGASSSSSIATLTLSTEMAGVLVNIFTEPSMKAKAAEYISADGFNGDISAYVLENTNFIDLKVTSSSPQEAYDLLTAVLAVYPEISDEIFENANISVVKMPSMATAPSNTISNENRNLIVSGIVSVVLAAIVALSLLRDTVKNESDFNEKIGVKLLGSILHENKRLSFIDVLEKRKKGLLIRSNAFISLKFTENFHKIAAKFEYLNRQTGDKVFAITSVAENEGKSTCAANIAVSLADRGHRVVLIDLDCKKPALYKIFSEKYEPNSEIANLFDGKISSKMFRLKKYKKSSLFLALNTKPYSDYYKWIENGEIEHFIELIKSKADFVIIDCSPITCDASVTDVVSLSDKSVMVVRTDVVKTSAINDSIDVIERISDNFFGCILNDVYPGLIPFALSGDDESDYYTGQYHRYGKYGKYGKYSNYSSK